MDIPENLAEELASSNITQTAELLKFALELATKIESAVKDDGKISPFESVGLGFSLLGPARTAFRGLKEVPSELKGLSPASVELLGDVIYGDVAARGDEWVTQCVNAGIGVARELVNLISILGNKPNWDNPPKPNVIPE